MRDNTTGATGAAGAAGATGAQGPVGPQGLIGPAGEGGAESAANRDSIDNLDVAVASLVGEVSGFRAEVADLTSAVEKKASRRGLWVVALAVVIAAVLGLGGAIYVNDLRVRAAEDACARGNVLRGNIYDFVATDVIGPNPSEGEQAILDRTRERFAPLDCDHLN